MKIQQIKTSKGEFLGVLVPDDAHSFEIITNVVEGGKHVCFLRGNPDHECNYTANLPDAEQYKIIGIQTEITEEQAKEVVEEQPYYDPTEPLCPIPFYKNYGLGHYKQTALESFNSLMQKLEIKPDTKTLIIQKIK